MSVYSDNELKELHSVEIDIAQEIIRICEKNNIPYVAIGGTTLGAVRHHGFIPWDDDMDVGMLRSDYDRFLKIAPEELSSDYFLSHFSTEKNAPAYFAKVKKNNTTFVEQGESNVDMHHGVFVDIFPYDEIPNDPKIIKKYKLKTKIIRQFFIFKLFWTAPLYKGVKFKYVIGNMARIFIHLVTIPIKRETLFKWLDREMQKYNGQGTGYITTEGLKAIETGKVFPGRKEKFENIELLIPNAAEDLLTMQYGNYMQLPPVEFRKGHKPVAFDLKKGYTRN